MACLVKKAMQRTKGSRNVGEVFDNKKIQPPAPKKKSGGPSKDSEAKTDIALRTLSHPA